MMYPLRGQQGQTLIEFLVGVGMVAAVIAGTVALLSTEWKRLDCARKVFEATHARLVGAPPPALDALLVKLEETPIQVTGSAWCGGRMTEKVVLKKLGPQFR